MAHIYPQSVYGQQSYGPPMPGFAPQRPPAVYQHQYYQPPPPPQQPPPPMIHSDSNAFRRDFAHRLSNLTFNSRVHIQELSMMAQDHPQYSHVVSQCLDHHIRQVEEASCCDYSGLNKDWIQDNAGAPGESLLRRTPHACINPAAVSSMHPSHSHCSHPPVHLLCR